MNAFYTDLGWFCVVIFSLTYNEFVIWLKCQDYDRIERALIQMGQECLTDDVLTCKKYTILSIIIFQLGIVLSPWKKIGIVLKPIRSFCFVSRGFVMVHGAWGGYQLPLPKTNHAPVHAPRTSSCTMHQLMHHAPPHAPCASSCTIHRLVHHSPVHAPCACTGSYTLHRLMYQHMHLPARWSKMLTHRFFCFFWKCFWKFFSASSSSASWCMMHGAWDPDQMPNSYPVTCSEQTVYKRTIRSWNMEGNLV